MAKRAFWVMGNHDQEQVDEQVRTTVQVGVNFIDTANIYSERMSEVMIGQALKNLSINSDDLILAKKVRTLDKVTVSRGYMDGFKKLIF